MAETKFFHIHRFNGQDYQLWKRQMEIYMVENRLKKYIDGTTPRPSTDAEAWERKDAEAQAFLMRGLQLNQPRYLSDCATAAEMWGRLRTIHAEKSDQSVQVLLNQFINAKMDTADTMADYIAKIVSLAQRLKDMRMEQKEPVVIAKILASLPEKYDNVRTAWYTVPRENQRLDKLTDHLINEEAMLNMRKQEVGANNDREAYYARGKNYNRKFRENDKRDQKSGTHSDNNEKRGNCHFCKKPGHWARDCQAKKTFLSKKNKSHSLLTENSRDTDDRNAELFNVESKVLSNSEDDTWYADSAATEHLCMKRECYKKLNMFNNNNNKVRVGDGGLLTAVGIGDIDIKVANSDGSHSIHTICNVWYVPGIKRNLLSIGRSSERGMRVIFVEGGRKVLFYRNNKFIVDGVRKDDKLYRLNLLPVIKSAEANAAIGNSLMDWHEKLGHVNFQTLRKMISISCVNDLKVTAVSDEKPFCEECVFGKQHRSPFPKHEVIRAKLPGELFHADLCGKMSQSSIGGANYFLLIKDDYSRYCFVFFLKEKSDVSNALCKFYADVQADGHEVRRLRTDCGKEFCNKDVKKFLLSKSIKHELTTPRAPEQNGYIERQNRTVIESAKSMLHARQLPLYLWGEATAAAVHVRNRTGTDTLNGKTPFEMWHGEKPSVNHLRIFGSTCYVHIPKEQRSKWEVNSAKMMMIGYSEGNKAYRVFDPVSRKCYVRRDVIFGERPDGDELVIIKNAVQTESNEKGNDNADNADEPEKLAVRRNPRLPDPREPYVLRGRLPSSSKTEDVAESKIAEVLFSACEPLTLQDALEAEDSSEWARAINEELHSLKENETWSLVNRPVGRNVISNRWIFKKKYAANGEIDRYKARLVVRGFSQKEGIDYNEVFAPVVKYVTVRTILSIVAADDLEMIQFDIKTAFLHGELNETIFMEQPAGFDQRSGVPIKEEPVWIEASFKAVEQKDP